MDRRTDIDRQTNRGTQTDRLTDGKTVRLTVGQILADGWTVIVGRTDGYHSFCLNAI